MKAFFLSHYKYISRFSLVGLLNTALDFFVFFLLFTIFGFGGVISHLMAFCVALANSFILNAKWTFQNLKRDQLFRQVLTFVLIGFSGLVVSTVTLAFLSPIVTTYPAKIIAIGASLIVNYLGSALIVFKKDDDNGDGG